MRTGLHHSIENLEESTSVGEKLGREPPIMEIRRLVGEKREGHGLRMGGRTGANLEKPNSVSENGRTRRQAEARRPTGNPENANSVDEKPAAWRADHPAGRPNVEKRRVVDPKRPSRLARAFWGFWDPILGPPGPFLDISHVATYFTGIGRAVDHRQRGDESGSP
jgi:hypothetical protein